MKIKLHRILFLLGIIGIIYSLSYCSNKSPEDANVKYKQVDVNVDDRVDDLLSRMTLTEKIQQMNQLVGLKHMQRAEKNISPEQLHNNDALGYYPGIHSTDVEKMIEKGEIGSFLHVVTSEEANYLQTIAKKSRLQIPLLIGIDAIHGNGLYHGATIYPTPIGLASTWDENISEQMSIETAKEMRASGSHWAFTPNIDIARDPRWGRVGETFGEDPYLVSKMGVAMIKGLQQGDFTGSEKVIACAKHLIGGGDPMNGTNASPLDISIRTLREMHLPPYKKAIQESNVYSIMAAHNEVNGIPCHENSELMTDILRKEFGFNGFYVSDWLDIERLHLLHKTAENIDDAFASSVNAGMDMHMHGPSFVESLVRSVENGIVPESRIDDACRMILTAKFKLGLFDNPFTDKNTEEKVVFNQVHQATALNAARKSIVLLKNNGILPLKKNKYNRIFITGPNADNQTILGDWSLYQPEDRVITIKEGLEAISTENNFILDYFDSGKIIGKEKDSDIDIAVKRAIKSDLAIIVVGENSLRYKPKEKTCGENMARAHINLAGKQLKLIQEIEKTGVPVIVILVNGRPISEEWVEENIPAIIETWEPGSFGGQAVAEILFGDVNPSGKLPITFPITVGQTKMYYNHKPSTYFHKYKFTPTTPLYHFGYGLSYTNFKFSNLKVENDRIEAEDNFIVSVEVENTGKLIGDEIVQVYIRDNYSSVTRPVKELKSYKRITLKPGGNKIIKFEMTTQDLAFYNKNMEWGVEKGDFTIMVGNSSRDEDLTKVNLYVNDTKILKY